MKRGGLGRGLDVLLPQSGELLETVVRDISIDEIDPNASQPRRDFDKEALEQLADSIRELELAHQCVLHGYSVRRLEELAKARPAVRQAAPKREAGPELMALQNAMREALGLKTTLSGTETRGKITLSYNSAQELEHLYEVIGRLLG